MNWELTAIMVTIILWAITTLFVTGKKLGEIQTDLAYIKNMIGNGTPGVFVRTKEIDLLMAAINSDKKEQSERMDRIQNQINILLEGSK